MAIMVLVFLPFQNLSLLSLTLCQQNNKCLHKVVLKKEWHGKSDYCLYCILLQARKVYKRAVQEHKKQRKDGEKTNYNPFFFLSLQRSWIFRLHPRFHTNLSASSCGSSPGIQVLLLWLLVEPCREKKQYTNLPLTSHIDGAITYLSYLQAKEVLLIH